MNPEEYYRNELEKKCKNKINEISMNQSNDYWEIVKEAVGRTFPSCKIITAPKEYNSLECIEYTYDKSQIVKSQNNKVSHYLNIGKHLIELEDNFIYYPEIHSTENDTVTFEADYIKRQMSELNEIVLSKFEIYKKEVAQIYSLKDELEGNFKKERIPFLFQFFSKACFTELSKKKETPLDSGGYDVENEKNNIATNKLSETTEESFESIDDYDDEESESEGIVMPNLCDFGKSNYSDFNIEESNIEEEFDYGEPDIDIEKEEELENFSYVDTDTIEGIIENSGNNGIADYGFTQRIDNHKRELQQFKKSRYGNLYAGRG